LAFPVAEWKEMAMLSRSTEIVEDLQNRFPGPLPSESKIGYLRGNVRRHPGSGWRVTMPGMMHEDMEEDGTVLVYWNEDLTIRVSRFTVSAEELSAASLLAPLTEGSESAVDFPLPEQKDILAKVCHEPYQRENAGDYYSSHLFAATDSGQVLHMSICYDDKILLAEAETIFASLSWQKN
jgi:hypothetical protein